VDIGVDCAENVKKAHLRKFIKIVRGALVTRQICHKRSTNPPPRNAMQNKQLAQKKLDGLLRQQACWLQAGAGDSSRKVSNDNGCGTQGLPRSTLYSTSSKRRPGFIKRPAWRIFSLISEKMQGVLP